MSEIAEEIKEHLRNATTVADVNTCAVHYAKQVVDLSKSRKAEDRVLAIQIKNLASYRRWCITEDERTGNANTQSR